VSGVFALLHWSFPTIIPDDCWSAQSPSADANACLPTARVPHTTADPHTREKSRMIDVVEQPSTFWRARLHCRIGKLDTV